MRNVVLLLMSTLPSDINECETDNGGCSDNCHNTPGSYYCSCNTGYHLTDGHLCKGQKKFLCGD